MIQYFKPHPWKIIEEGFNPSMNEIAESVFSIGNGMMGQRANLEETYTGKTLQGTYVGGVYYPDKTRVGWWKNGYPEYFAKVINSTYWSGLMIFIDGTEIDLNTGTILDFYRELDMKNGCLYRKCTVKLQNGIEVRIESKRFYSLINKEYSALSYSLTTDSDCNIQLVNYLDADISNKDSNYNEKFWDGLQSESFGDELHILAKTNKLNWIVGTSAKCEIFEDGQKIHPKSEHFHSEKQCKTTYQIPTAANKTIRFVKHVITSSNFNHTDDAVLVHGKKSLQKMAASGFDVHLKMNANAWQEKWKTSDVVIQGDVSAQQAVRFNIYQLNQTYCGDDPRLNIGPKGFTGEKYGGSTYWDTEAYCIPFYLVSSDLAISKQLLVYRYKQLDKAIENAQKLGFNNGAALYPMVTMNGEECHNEWEITFEEIHRNGAIAYAIYNYIEHTADTHYLFEGGFEVLLGISRFWAQRVHWSEKQKRFEMHGVTGPNEYENNVNNNWYTSYIAMWCLKYTTEVAQKMHLSNPESFAKIAKKTAFELVDETSQWNHIQQNMYFPYDKEYNVFVQHDGFMEKSLLPVAQLAEEHRPLNQKWSWDRILRSVYIKQADVLQGLYFFEDDFDEDTHRRNFEFYEQFTVHESSLSPCVHSILAAKIGNFDKAYEMYVRTARLDLDNYNNDTEDGLHITSMAGSYLSIVQGFGGLRIKNQALSIRPVCPPQWEGYQFNILLLNQPIRVSVEKSKTTIENLGDKSIQIQVNGVHYTVKSGEEVFVNQ